MRIKFSIGKLVAVTLFITVTAFLYSYHNSLSYDDQTTHPAITDEIVDFYNLSFGDKLTPEEKEWIVQGSIDEDTPPRWINHFYDPIYKNGWTGEYTGFWSSSTIQSFSALLSTEDPVSSLNWLHNELLQAKYSNYEGNNTWENAIRQYAKGNRKEAYQILGHILHLLEDKTVPDHTRNDTHAHELEKITLDYGSPYEEYLKQYTRQNIGELNIPNNLKKENINPIKKSSIDEYLISLAGYSNKYFFSKDTISDSKYQNPKVIRDDGNFGYGIDENREEFPLARGVNTKTDRIYILDINDEYVLSAYFSRLSRQAVLNGAGAIKLFHDEAEKVKRREIVLPPEPQVAWWQEMRSPYFGAATIYASIKNTFSGIVSYFTNALSGILTPPSPEMLVAQLSNVGGNNVSGDVNVSNQTPSPSAQTPSVPVSLPQSTSTNPIVVSAPTNQINIASSNILPPDSNSWEKVTSTVPAAEFVATTATTTATTTIPVVSSYKGGGYVSGVSPANAAAQEQQVNFSESNSTTTDSTSSNNATSTDNAATSTDPVFDNASSTDAVLDSGSATSTEATSTEEIITATTTSSTLPDILPGYFNAPVVINEVAWMGTKAQANDEWIELYNKTSQEIDLSGWTLENSNQSLKAQLKGTIQSKSYFLLERTASTTTDQSEDQIYTGVLNNEGWWSDLYLKNASSTVIDYVPKWYAGDNTNKSSRRAMERISPYLRGETLSNWGTYISSTSTPPFAKDADGNDIFGTPGVKNSVSTYTPVIDQINQNITWYKELSPYYAIYKIGVAREAILTIQSGVTAKFTNGTGLEISGSLQAEGIESDPIIFTSNSQTSKPGDWLNIIFSNPSQTSILKYTHIQYGGQGINYNPNSSTPTYTGAVSIINSSPIITNSTFDNNQSIAIYIAGNSNPKITGNIIKNTDSYTYKNGPLNGFGIQIADSNATAEISNNKIENNSIGIKSASASATPLIIKDNVFANNGVNGEFQTNTFLNIDNSGNQDLNKQSGFVLKLNLISNQTTTLKKDILPYIISEYLVISASSTLVIEPSAVLKNSMGYHGDSYWRVYGVLKAKGTLDQPIIFTSASDDIDGYNQGGQPKPGDWNRLYFNGDIASQSEADHVFFRYGGRMCIICTREGYCRQSDGAVLIENSSPTITNSTFEFNNQPDMKIRGASSPILENNTLEQTVIE